MNQRDSDFAGECSERPSPETNRSVCLRQARRRVERLLGCRLPVSEACARAWWNGVEGYWGYWGDARRRYSRSARSRCEGVMPA